MSNTTVAGLILLLLLLFSWFEARSGNLATDSGYRAPGANGVPRPDHVVIVIEENHSYSEIIGSSAAPYINSLAAQGALFTQSYATTHPSQPNYLHLFSGSNQGVTNDSCPHSFSTANLGDTCSTPLSPSRATPKTCRRSAHPYARRAHMRVSTLPGSTSPTYPQPQTSLLVTSQATTPPFLSSHS